MKKSLEVWLSMNTLEDLAQGEIVVIEHPELLLRLCADMDAVKAFKEQIHAVLLSTLNQSNQSIH